MVSLGATDARGEEDSGTELIRKEAEATVKLSPLLLSLGLTVTLDRMRDGVF
jgi:hypothetical protein